MNIFLFSFIRRHFKWILQFDRITLFFFFFLASGGLRLLSVLRGAVCSIMISDSTGTKVLAITLLVILVSVLITCLAMTGIVSGTFVTIGLAGTLSSRALFSFSWILTLYLTLLSSQNSLAVVSVKTNPRPDSAIFSLVRSRLIGLDLQVKLSSSSLLWTDI